MPVRDEGGEVTKIRTFMKSPENRFHPQLITTEWIRKFTFVPRVTVTDTKTKPCSIVYTRQREMYVLGQRLLLTEWQTQGEYLMTLLKEQ